MTASPSVIGRVFSGPLRQWQLFTSRASALYANKFNTLFKDDLSRGEAFGFAKNQVTPFNLSTPDGEVLFAWHVLPLDVYARNEHAIRHEERPHGPVADFTQTTAFKLLTSTSPSPARVVVSFHGNAGHIAQGWRTDTYRNVATQPNTHVLAIDYRGFGHSTGAPSEAGLIADGAALVDWLLAVARIPPERIVLLGQSLGTAVASAVALHFADPDSALIPALPAPQQAVAKAPQPLRRPPTAFAGIVLAAPFSSVPSLLLTYRLAGVLPLLLPLRPLPALAHALTARVLDTWRTADRLAAYYRVDGLPLRAHVSGGGGDNAHTRRMGSLQLIHATNDADIPYHQTEMICRRVLEDAGGGRCIDGSKGAAVLDLEQEGRPRVRFEIVEFGGHNRIITYTPVAVAIVRAIEDLYE